MVTSRRSIEDLDDFKITLRLALADIDFILVKSLKYIDGNLRVVAMKIMGFETDIETYEFEISLEPKYFENDKFYAYKSNLGYTVPLDPFFFC